MTGPPLVVPPTVAPAVEDELVPLLPPVVPGEPVVVPPPVPLAEVPESALVEPPVVPAEFVPSPVVPLALVAPAVVPLVVGPPLVAGVGVELEQAAARSAASHAIVSPRVTPAP
jgi:hypothetical protein